VIEQHDISAYRRTLTRGIRWPKFLLPLFWILHKPLRECVLVSTIVTPIWISVKMLLSRRRVVSMVEKGKITRTKWLQSWTRIEGATLAKFQWHQRDDQHYSWRFVKKGNSCSARKRHFCSINSQIGSWKTLHRLGKLGKCKLLINVLKTWHPYFLHPVVPGLIVRVHKRTRAHPMIC